MVDKRDKLDKHWLYERKNNHRHNEISTIIHILVMLWWRHCILSASCMLGGQTLWPCWHWPIPHSYKQNYVLPLRKFTGLLRLLDACLHATVSISKFSMFSSRKNKCRSCENIGSPFNHTTIEILCLYADYFCLQILCMLCFLFYYIKL